MPNRVFPGRDMASVLQQSTTPIGRLLSRLENVQQFNQGYRTACPAHGSGKNRTLSVAVAEDGRALIHCFAGCSPLDIVHAVGLEMCDLFPARITHATTPAQLRELRESGKQAQWRAALPLLMSDATIVLLAGQQVLAGIPLDEADFASLETAVNHIASVRMVFRA